MKTIYFVRHGSTEGVEQNLCQRFDHPLSELGVQQAVKAAEYFKEIKIDAIIASDMTRALETAQIIKREAGLTPEIQTTKLLHEIHRPSIVRGRAKSDPEVAGILKQLEQDFADIKCRHSDEENFFDLKTRAASALSEVLSINSDTILATTHSAFLKMLLAVTIFGENLDVDTYRKIKSHFSVENTSISKFVYKDHAWKVLSWNDHGHLLDEIE